MSRKPQKPKPPELKLTPKEDTKVELLSLWRITVSLMVLAMILWCIFRGRYYDAAAIAALGLLHDLYCELRLIGRRMRQLPRGSHLSEEACQRLRERFPDVMKGGGQ